MADFARIFKWLQTGFPPSSRELHQPGQLIEPVSLVHPVYTGGWSTPDWAVGSYQSNPGQAIVSQGAPPVGSVRVIMACSGKYSTPAAGPYHIILHLNIAGTATLATHLSSTYEWGAAALPAADVYLPLCKTLIFGPAYELRCSRTGGADATATTTLQCAYIDLKYGEFDPAFLCG
jgi:hypothetical protein